MAKIAIALLIALAIAGCGRREDDVSKWPKAQSSYPVTAEMLKTPAYVPPPPRGPWTMADYNRVQPGMTWADAYAQLGPGGVETSRTAIGNQTTFQYIFQNPNGSGLVLMISGDRVISKTQVGL